MPSLRAKTVTDSSAQNKNIHGSSASEALNTQDTSATTQVDTTIQIDTATQVNTATQIDTDTQVNTATQDATTATPITTSSQERGLPAKEVTTQDAATKQNKMQTSVPTQKAKAARPRCKVKMFAQEAAVTTETQFATSTELDLEARDDETKTEFSQHTAPTQETGVKLNETISSQEAVATQEVLMPKSSSHWRPTARGATQTSIPTREATTQETNTAQVETTTQKPAATTTTQEPETTTQKMHSSLLSSSSSSPLPMLAAKPSAIYVRDKNGDDPKDMSFLDHPSLRRLGADEPIPAARDDMYVLELYEIDDITSIPANIKSMIKSDDDGDGKIELDGLGLGLGLELGAEASSSRRGGDGGVQTVGATGTVGAVYTGGSPDGVGTTVAASVGNADDGVGSVATDGENGATETVALAATQNAASTTVVGSVAGVGNVASVGGVGVGNDVGSVTTNGENGATETVALAATQNSASTTVVASVDSVGNVSSVGGVGGAVKSRQKRDVDKDEKLTGDVIELLLNQRNEDALKIMNEKGELLSPKFRHKGYTMSDAVAASGRAHSGLVNKMVNLKLLTFKRGALWVDASSRKSEMHSSIGAIVKSGNVELLDAITANDGKLRKEIAAYDRVDIENILPRNAGLDNMDTFTEMAIKYSQYDVAKKMTDMMFKTRKPFIKSASFVRVISYTIKTENADFIDYMMSRFSGVKFDYLSLKKLGIICTKKLMDEFSSYIIQRAMKSNGIPLPTLSKILMWVDHDRKKLNIALHEAVAAGNYNAFKAVGETYFAKSADFSSFLSSESVDPSSPNYHIATSAAISGNSDLFSHLMDSGCRIDTDTSGDVVDTIEAAIYIRNARNAGKNTK